MIDFINEASEKIAAQVSSSIANTFVGPYSVFCQALFYEVTQEGRLQYMYDNGLSVEMISKLTLMPVPTIYSKIDSSPARRKNRKPLPTV